MKAYKFATITTNGYISNSQYLVMVQTSNGAIDVSETATAQIRNAFKKANKGKKENELCFQNY